MDKATKEQRAALVERMKLFLEIEGVPTEQQIALMEKYEAEMGEELFALYDDYMWERGTLEEVRKDMPNPHNKAIIVFGGEEMPYSQNVDNLGENGQNKSAATGGAEVVVKGDEFGQYKDIKELRAKAVQYYSKNLQGTSVENKVLGKIDIDENGIVNFTGSGKREMKGTSAKTNKLLLVKYLPQLIAGATNITSSEAEKERHANETFYYLHTSATIDGDNVPVEITLVKRNDGSIQYYNHILPAEENNKNTSVSPGPESSREALGTPAVDVSFGNQNIPRNRGNVNEKTNNVKANESRSDNQGGFSDGQKQAQFEIIQRENPMQDDIHTGIRSADEIKDASEVFSEDTFEGINPDFTEADAKKAMATGRIKVYSSKPIKNGGFVSTSRMMAKDYAGDGNIYEQEVSVDDVAWIDETEGQFAKVQGGFSDGQILDQNGGKVTRGRIWRDRRQGKKIIQLLSTADRSTFLHEMGHLFLMDLEDLAAMGDEESQRMLDEVDDWAKWQGKGDAKKYAGTAWAKEFVDREAAILEADRAGDLLGRDALMARWRQERFARAWEIYLMEGTAPSKGLRAVFRKFKSWLRKIYNVFLSDGARASKDVEKVMARLIASEEEIERMEADARYTDFAAAGDDVIIGVSTIIQIISIHALPAEGDSFLPLPA